MKNHRSEQNSETLRPWFFSGWLAPHVGSSFLASILRAWVAPVLFSAYLAINETGEVFLLAIFISLIVALVVSFGFSLVVYPFLQLAFRPLLSRAQSGKEVAWMLLPFQQLLIWAVALGTALTDFNPVLAPSNPIFQFSAIVSFHAALHLFAYSKRMWRIRNSKLTVQIPTLEHELAATNSEGVPLGFIE